METLSLKTKKQIVLSRIIYDYIINGLTTGPETEVQRLRLNVCKWSISRLSISINELALLTKMTPGSELDMLHIMLGINTGGEQ